MKLIARIIVSLLSLALVGCVSSGVSDTNLSAESKLRAAKINVELGMAYMAQNNNDLAKGKLLKALDLAPNYPEAHAALGYYYAQLGNPQMAQGQYQQAINLGPQDPVVLDSYASFLCNQGQYQAANHYFLKALAIPNNTVVGNSYLNAGICQFKSNNLALAQDYFIKALKQNSNLNIAYFELAEVSYQTGQYVNAQNYINQYQQRVGVDFQSLSLAINIADKLGNKDRAASLRLLMQANYPNQLSS